MFVVDASALLVVTVGTIAALPPTTLPVDRAGAEREARSHICRAWQAACSRQLYSSKCFKR